MARSAYQGLRTRPKLGVMRARGEDAKMTRLTSGEQEGWKETDDGRVVEARSAVSQTEARSVKLSMTNVSESEKAG